MTQLPLLDHPSSPSEDVHDDLLSIVIPPLEGEYLYTFDRQSLPSLLPGCIVEVQLGRRSVHGYVISVNSERERVAASEMNQRNIRIKPIPKESIPVHAFSPNHLEFLEWIARYYAEPLSKILDLAIPTPAFGRRDPFVRISHSTENVRIGPAQQRVLDHLALQTSWMRMSELKRACDVTSTIISALKTKGLILISEELPQDAISETIREPVSLMEKLSEEQQVATRPILECVTRHSFSSFLLHGVTGSGKTEVYLELIIEALKMGRSALVIVPEIALTPQLLHRFESRLLQKVSVLHSSLRPHERWQHWSDVLSGKTKVVIGARSAIFAPMKDLGVIVVDEEHDGSFKQGEGVRYNARDLALVRAKLSHCPVVLGSATPSLESFHNAKTGKHALVTLNNRFFSSSPLAFDIVDLTRLKPWEMPSRNISPILLKYLKEVIENGEQAFVLYNRRGFASYLQCSGCETVVGCPHCSVTLTYHRNNNSLLCHFCGFTTPPPSACLSCGAKDPTATGDMEAEPLFQQRGAGTERVYEEISTLLPTARLAKLDRDAVRSLEDYTSVLHKVRAKEVDILVGTQMIAKGHDLPDVTLVGIVDCDVGLHVPDFRAAERALQLLTQVAGRAGRREKRGRVILQTRVPQHPSLQMTMRANFIGFAEQELAMREALGYPPFQRLLRVIVGAPEKETAHRIAADLAEKASPVCEQHSISLLGPAPAPIEKVRSFWRYHILFKAASAAKLQNLMLRLKKVTPPNKDTRIVFDLEPQDML